METPLNSTPTLLQFEPVIPYQKELINKIRKNLNYNLGTHEILLSGSVGSAKSTIAAHLAVTHCLFNKGARVLLGRRSLPDVKRTIFQKVIEHIGGDLKQGEHFTVNSVRGSIDFLNGSQIISVSWADKRYFKFRSLDLSAAIFEELVESEGDDIKAYQEIKMRVGRLPHIKENFILSCTNPSSPSSHWYKYFMLEKKETRQVIYSITTDNPFLPAKYIEQLKSDLDPKMARRMIYGEWLDISTEKIYYNYDSNVNYRNEIPQIDPRFPIDLMHDFNIGENKPMSAAFGQYINGTFYVYKSFIIEGARTMSILEEMDAYGLFKYKNKFRVFGDASGKSRDTRSIKSDYDIIREFLSNYKRADGSKVEFEILVPLANPPIKERHNKLNSLFMNMNKEVHFINYDKDVDEGFRLTKLKKGGSYIEDDSFQKQHVTTAIGYWTHFLSVRLKETKAPYRR